MSTRIHFRPVKKDNLNEIIGKVETLYQYASYDENRNDISPLIKSRNESFWDLGTNIIQDAFNLSPNSHREIIGHYTPNNPIYSTVITVDSIKEYLNGINKDFVVGWNENKNLSFQHTIELLEFCIENELEISIH